MTSSCTDEPVSPGSDSAALEDIRVLDLSCGPAAGLATMMLADFGAEVLHVPPVGTDAFSDVPGARVWRRGKHRLPLDLDNAEDLATFNDLCGVADVLVCDWRPVALARRAIDLRALRAAHPRLTVCHVTGFGSTGPLADLPGYEHAVAAHAGRMMLFSGIADRPGPVFSSLQVGVHACAQSATSGILAALLARRRTGSGTLVETSLLQGLLAYEQGAMIGRQLADELGEHAVALQPTPGPPPLPTLFYHPAQAADGRWMQFGNLLPHLFENFLIATDLVDVLADPAFDSAQMAMTDAEAHEAFRDRMLLRIQQRNAADWIRDFTDNGGIVATAYQTTQQALDDPDLIENGHVVTIDGVRQLGPVARLSSTPGRPRRAHANGGAVADRWLSPQPAAAASQSGITPSAGTQADNAPLAHVRVVELATIIAAPLGACFLADMGADVIKVEPVGGDPYRSMAHGTGAARVNAGKRSLSLNLKTPAGRDAVLRLIDTADVVIHNYRPGVAERLGIGFEAVAERNPRLVYVQCNGYGPDGPSAHRPSTHPVPGAALGGALFHLGERVPDSVQPISGLRSWTSRLMRANELNPDPNTALVVANAALLGLSARERTGRGQRVLVDMFGANAYANHDDFVAYAGKPKRALPDAKLQGLSPTYRLYPCADSQWLFVCLLDSSDQARFIDVVTTAGLRAPSLKELQRNDAAAAVALGTLFLRQSADAWERLCAPRALACLRADAAMPASFWLTGEQPQALALSQHVDHPQWSGYRRHGQTVTCNGTAVLGGAQLAGQHNDELLREIGYNGETIATLYADGVLWHDPYFD